MSGEYVRSKASVWFSLLNIQSCPEVFTNLLRVSSFFAVVLNEVDQAVHHCFHCYQPFL